MRDQRVSLKKCVRMWKKKLIRSPIPVRMYSSPGVWNDQ